MKRLIGMFIINRLSFLLLLFWKWTPYTFKKNEVLRYYHIKSGMFQMKSAAIIFFIIILSLSKGNNWGGTSFAQITSRQDKQLLLKADKAFDFGDYFSALQIYESLFLIDSTDNETNFKLGVCNFEIKKLRTHSKKYFDKVPPEDFPDVNYYLGKLNHLLKQYDRAIYYFNQFKYFGGDNDYSRKEIDDLIEKCHVALQFETTPDKTVSISNMGNIINSAFSEYVPLIPADEKFMLFTSRRENTIWPKTDPTGDYYEDIYISKKDSATGNWTAPTMLDTTINTLTHDACTGLSSDGEKLLIYRTSKDLKSGDIYESFYTNNKWSKPEQFSSIVNSSDFSETSACYSPNGDIIFFSSNRSGGFGGKDIYLVRKLLNGKWGKPFNLGPTINTEYDEDAPFVHPLGDVLFFSSEGHKNMGGYDIFKSTFDEKGVFAEPGNLGSPINTVDDDIFFVMNTDASKGYFSSEREGGFGLQDIYSVTFPVTATSPLNVSNIHVVDETNSIIKDVEIKLINLENESTYGIYKANDRTGKIVIISQKNKEYRIIIDSPGFERSVMNASFENNVNLLYKLTKVK